MQRILYFFPICLFLLSFSMISAQVATAPVLKYSLVRVYFSEHHGVQELAALGVECDHGHYARGRFLENVFSTDEIEQIRLAGFSFDIPIADMAAYYLAHREETGSAQSRSADCAGASDVLSTWTTPQNYTYGSMGGYHTWAELLMVLDDMRAKFPALITAKTPVSTSLNTQEGRPIYWLRISDNPDQDEPEPEVLYTALHHAREPNSLSQMLFYMWYLLEHYATDPEIKALVDNTEMYFIPCINPDGYVFNQTTSPQGGGLWRKNRGSNGGVDLNRNYGAYWGYNNQGSSPDNTSETYRGPSPFSEFETQAVKLFCDSHDFKIALNAHTFSNLLIYPFGYNNLPTPDQEAFQTISELMVAQNNFNNGLTIETVGYAANGNSDDWMYTESPEKGKILAMTPEIGTTFWPLQSQIIPLNQSMMWTNLTAARVLHHYGIATASAEPIGDLSSKISFELKRYGLADGSLTVSLMGLSSNVLGTGSPKTFMLAPFASITDEISFSLNPAIVAGAEIVLLLKVENGLWAKVDTLRRVWTPNSISTSAIIFEEPGTALSNWNTSGGWGITTNQFVSAPSSITDSPNGSYADNSISLLTLNNPINLTAATAAKLTFFAQWDLEAGYDYVQVLGRSDATAFQPLCGKFTKPGSLNQDAGQPLYDGNQNDWVAEEIDLTDYLGGKLWLRFRLVSDAVQDGDGFYFDDLKVTSTLTSTAASSPISGIPTFDISPNPAQEIATIRIGYFPNNGVMVKLSVFNALGQRIETSEVDALNNAAIRHFDTSGWQQGLYFIRLETMGGLSVTKVLSVIR